MIIFGAKNNKKQKETSITLSINKSDPLSR